jgi:hypothetical protein
MPDLFLDLRRIDYVSDQNVSVSAGRAYAEALFVTPGGLLVPFSWIVDPGAPFSVLPSAGPPGDGRPAGNELLDG